MAVKTKKNVKEASLRTPKAKSKLGLSVPRIGMPHGEFVRGDSEKRADLDSVIGVSGQGGQTGLSGVPGLSSVSGVSGETELSGLGSVTAASAQTSQTSLTDETNTSRTGVGPAAEEKFIGEPADTAVVPLFNEPKVGSGDEPNNLEPPPLTAPTTQSTLSSLSTVTGQSSYPPIGSDERHPFPSVAPEIPVTIAPAFRGKSAQLFDVIYNLTLGAAVPQRRARIRKGELMRRAEIGSRNTFTANLEFLINAGLVAQTVIAGESDGNEFEILQVPAMTGQTGQTTQTAQPLVHAKTENAANAAPLQAFADKLENASLRLTGKSLTDSDRAELAQLADIVIKTATKDPRLGQPGASLVAIAVERLAET